MTAQGGAGRAKKIPERACAGQARRGRCAPARVAPRPGVIAPPERGHAVGRRRSLGPGDYAAASSSMSGFRMWPVGGRPASGRGPSAAVRGSSGRPCSPVAATTRRATCQAAAREVLQDLGGDPDFGFGHPFFGGMGLRD